MEVVAKILAKKALRDVKQKNTNSTVSIMAFYNNLQHSGPPGSMSNNSF